MKSENNFDKSFFCYNIHSKKYLKLRKKFHSELDKIQFQGSIKKNKFLLVSCNYKNGGFGAQIGIIAFCLKLGLIFNRTVLFDFSNMGYSNLFEDFSKFKIDDLKEFKIKKMNFLKNQKDKVVLFEYNHDFFLNNKNLLSWKPNYWLIDEAGDKLLAGEILSRIKPNKTTIKKILKIEKKIGFKNPIIGCQIRRGDKYLESKPVEINCFFDKIKLISKEKSIKNVFITSDSEKTFKELPCNLGLNYVYDKNEKRYNSANHLIASKNKFLGYQEAFTALKIIYLLSKCDYLVGQKNTHLTNIASKIHLINHGCDSFIGVDFEYYSNKNFLDLIKQKIRFSKRIFDRVKLLFLN